MHHQNLIERMQSEYSLQAQDVLNSEEPEWEAGTDAPDREALETMVAEFRTKLQSMARSISWLSMNIRSWKSALPS